MAWVRAEKVPYSARLPAQPPSNTVLCAKCGEKTDLVSGYTLGALTLCKQCWNISRALDDLQQKYLDSRTPDVVKSEAFALLAEIEEI